MQDGGGGARETPRALLSITRTLGYFFFHKICGRDVLLHFVTDLYRSFCYEYVKICNTKRFSRSRTTSLQQHCKLSMK